MSGERPYDTHPDVASLAELDADALQAPTEAAALHVHVASCPGCQHAQARIVDVRRQLADLSAQPLPVDVAERIRAVLAAEGRAQRSTEAAAAPLRPAQNRRRRLRPSPGLVAASVIVLLVLGVGASALRWAGPSGSGATSANRVTSRASGRSDVRPADGTILLATGRDYSPGSLDADVRGLLSTRASTNGSAPANSTKGLGPDAVQPGRTGASVGTDPLVRLRQPTALAACVRTLTAGRTVTPLVVDYAQYRGQPAVVVVLPGPTVRTVLVYVAPASCGPQHPAFLDYHQVGR